MNLYLKKKTVDNCVFIHRLGVMLWQISLAVIKFRQNPVATSITYNASTELEFPAVTICNLNPIRLASLEEADGMKNLKELVDGVSNLGIGDLWVKETCSMTMRRYISTVKAGHFLVDISIKPGLTEKGRVLYL